MTLKSRPWALMRLEDRVVPATSGITWPDAAHLTLSFVPDGAQVGAYTSSLFATLNKVAPTATWEREIVRAFQTWVINANLNIGIVADYGAGVGSAGAVQGDPRYGDVRVAAAALPPSTVMTNTPFVWSGSTWAGTVLINSNYVFSVAQGQVGAAYDLFSCILNEAGNVFGVLDSQTDTASGV